MPNCPSMIKKTLAKTEAAWISDHIPWASSMMLFKSRMDKGLSKSPHVTFTQKNKSLKAEETFVKNWASEEMLTKADLHSL